MKRAPLFRGGWDAGAFAHRASQMDRRFAKTVDRRSGKAHPHPGARPAVTAGPPKTGRRVIIH